MLGVGLIDPVHGDESVGSNKSGIGWATLTYAEIAEVKYIFSRQSSSIHEFYYICSLLCGHYRSARGGLPHLLNSFLNHGKSSTFSLGCWGTQRIGCSSPLPAKEMREEFEMDPYPLNIDKMRVFLLHKKSQGRK